LKREKGAKEEMKNSETNREKRGKVSGAEILCFFLLLGAMSWHDDDEMREGRE